jgi:betaine-aldehyde dehydrogenase
MKPLYPLFINGKFYETDKRRRIVNPATGESITEVCVADNKAVDAALDAAHRGASGPWRNISLKERKGFILKISQGILDQAQELAQIETLNTGKPIKESTFMDIPSSAETFKYFAENLERFLEAQEIPIQSQIAQAASALVREPLGVAVLIVPWNYPLLIASWKLAQALAAGNTVILKPSSLTPVSALVLGQIIKDAALPPGVVNIISGPGEVVGPGLCTDKRVDMISFTGSNGVGREIMEYASANVKKLTIELGGKSAGIILADADIEAAVNGSLCSIFLNQGQMCTAMSRILAEDSIYDLFVKDFVDKAQRIKLGPGMDFETQMGPLVSENQRAKVLAFVKKARAEGAQVLCGGKIPADPALKNGFFFEPTVIAGVTPSMSIFKEEIFGPVACVAKFSSAEEAVELANASDYALAANIWSGDTAKARQLAGKINAGTVWINTYGMFFNEVPYGGFKQSGFGKELGSQGFLEYTRLKNVITDHTSPKPLVNYWYGF